MLLWLVVTALPLVVGQSVAPAFRPDTVTTVTGTVRCGNSPVGFITIEWWEDRGQQVDTLLGSTRSDASGRFQVSSSRPASPNSYLFIRSDCNGRNEASRFDVDLLAPFNMQIQLRTGSNGGVSQISGQVWCGSSPSRFSTIEWWADRGSQVDLMLGVGQSDNSGFFVVRRTQTSYTNTYVIVKSNCGGNGMTTRFPVDLRQPNNMQLQLQRSGGSNQVSGTVFCGRQPAVWQPVEWWADRGNQFDVSLGSSQTDGRGFFIITSSRPVDGRTYLLLKNRCNGREQTTRVSVSSSNPNNMQIQLQSGRGGRGFGDDTEDEDNDFESGEEGRHHGHHRDHRFRLEASTTPDEEQPVSASDLGDYIDVNTVPSIQQ